MPAFQRDPPDSGGMWEEGPRACPHQPVVTQRLPRSGWSERASEPPQNCAVGELQIRDYMTTELGSHRCRRRSVLVAVQHP